MTPEESARLGQLEAQGGPVTPEYVALVNKLAAHNLKMLESQTAAGRKKTTQAPKKK